MDTLKTVMKKLGITDRKHFDAWLTGTLKPRSPHKRLMDAYQTVLKEWNDAEEERSVWIQKHVDDPVAEFNKGYKRWQDRLKRLQKVSRMRLERLLREYLKDSAKA